MNALELADALTAEWNGEGFNPDTSKDAAALLRRQHEVILKLREVLGTISYVTEWGGDLNSAQADAEKALKDTEDLK